MTSPAEAPQLEEVQRMEEEREPAAVAQEQVLSLVDLQ